jgi:hypothetical protein
MSEIITYLDRVELALVGSPVIAEYHVIRSWANTDDGYIRLRASLVNGDFLEAAEYFVLDRGQIMTVDYRYQWMDSSKTILRRRWDSTPDHPELENFPHHIHLGDETHIVSGHSLSLIELLNVLESELSLRP